jgi:UDP-GlcNAc:undecaprenyl-phosphate GlcNAc-1-phosphate transferase
MGSRGLTLAILAMAACAASALATLALIRLGPRLRFTAQPRDDRWHKHATPNTGGVAVLFACGLVYLVALHGLHTAVVLAAAAMSIVGFIDDRIRLRALPKFLLQCALALAVVSSGTVFHASPWHAVNVAFSFLWIVGITNSFNLIDNMDGLSAGVAIIISAFRVFALAAGGFWPDAALAAVLAGAFAGFLIFNYHPARIFMGDCGSMLAGFALAATTIASPLPHTKAFAAAVFYPVLTFIYPIFDTLLVSSLRTAAGRPISVGGRDHSSHRLVALGLGERQVVWLLWSLTALGSAVGLLTRHMPLAVVAAAAVLIAALSIFGLFLSRVTQAAQRQLPDRRHKTPRLVRESAYAAASRTGPIPSPE